MLRRILQGLMGQTVKPSQPSSQEDISPFRYLNALKSGLPARAELFFLTGEDRAVLADIKTMMAKNSNFLPGRTDSKAASATNDLCFVLGGHPERLARYAELRVAMNWGVSTYTGKSQGHLDTIPEDIRILLEVLKRRHNIKTETPTSWADLRKAVEILGGTDADIITFILPTERYSNRSLNLKLSKNETTWSQFQPTSLMTALDRCDGKGRNMALKGLKKQSFVTSPEFLNYLFKQSEETSATLRATAVDLLREHNGATVEPMAADTLKSKKATARAFGVQVLGMLGTPSALAMLKAHKDTEKSQTVLTALELFVGAPVVETKTIENGYIDIHGAHITLPPHIELIDDGSAPLDESFNAQFHPIEEKMRQDAETRYQNSYDYWIKQNKKHSEPTKDKVLPIGPAWFEVLNVPVTIKPAGRHTTGHRLPHKHRDSVAPVIEVALDKLPLRRVIDLACRNAYTLSSILTWTDDVLNTYVQNAITDGRISLSQLVTIAEENHVSSTNYAKNDEIGYDGNYLTEVIYPQSYYHGRYTVPRGIWAIAASHLPILIEKLPPRGSDIKTAIRAMEVIADFPSLPADLVQPLLFVAIDDRARLREPAQKLLADAPGIDDQLIAILSDKRQAVRANAARFLADRGAKSALPALTKRLKTEKSELARADLISAVSRLGGDTTPYLGRDALIKEAQKFVEKLPNEKLNWLPLSTAPSLKWKDKTTADPVVLDGWLRLALKLKSPLGSPLFGLYFDQMTPQSVSEVADWVLNSWVSYDTDRPVGEAARTKAAEMAKHMVAQQNNWMALAGYTEQQIAEQILRGMSSGYPNSGADSKGILALAHRATSAKAGPLIATYLKQHGKRVSQAKALVETLYGMGTQDAVQVLVATATRFKQRTVRELAETLVSELAEARGWTQDELADRSVPTGGFEDDGTMLLEVGEDAKPYTARLSSDLTVKLYNPQGKEVKSIPAGKDANTKESKSLLSTAKKTIKTAQAQQQARLYDAMISSRSWERQAWQDDLTKHPIMQRLIERVIWRGLDDNGAFITGLRLTPEGEVLNAAGDDVDLSTISKIDIAHTANLSEDDRNEWLQHLKDFEVKPLFPQVSRPVRTLTDAQSKDTKLSDREGWLMTTFKLRSAAKKAGYDRAPIGDGGGFDAYRKEFRGAQIWADLYFTGSYVSEDDIPAAIRHMQFTQMGEGGRGRALTLEKVPALLLSEVWNDMHEMAKSGAFDPEWEKKGLY
ncbi:DUF4132 domain-containing protein [Yoonia maritima]|uniref:DUF4132 domain-containing protein n=1 Tax=Yoonia maritima TaxID=1435347 RepID=UPI000D107D3B|nr:DUF4132 domain-containing protein [Yoonia maritima]